MNSFSCSFVLTLRLMCLPVKKRFPTLDHLVEAGILTEGEKKVSSRAGGANTELKCMLKPIPKWVLNGDRHDTR